MNRMRKKPFEIAPENEAVPAVKPKERAKFNSPEYPRDYNVIDVTEGDKKVAKETVARANRAETLRKVLKTPGTNVVPLRPDVIPPDPLEQQALRTYMDPKSIDFVAPVTEPLKPPTLKERLKSIFSRK